MSDISNATSEAVEMASLRTARALPSMFMGFWGIVKGYDPTTGRVSVMYAYGLASTQPQWMPLLTEFGGQGYGSQDYPEEGTLVQVLQLAPDGDDVVAVARSYNDKNLPPRQSLRPSEKVIVDKRGSAIEFSLDGAVQDDGQGGLRLTGAGYALLMALGQGPTEVGGRNMDPILDAAITVRSLIAIIENVFNPYLAAFVAAGSGAPPIDTSSITGSSTVRIAN